MKLVGCRNVALTVAASLIFQAYPCQGLSRTHVHNGFTRGSHLLHNDFGVDYEGLQSHTRMNASGTASAFGPTACGVKLDATVTSDWRHRCPQECPLWAEHKGNECTFSCVGASIQDCRAVNPRQPVADLDRGVCRGCNVRGCALCALDGTDSCLVCASGHVLIGGHCWAKALPLWFALGLLLLLAFAVIIAWVVDLFTRPTTNLLGLEHGLIQRSRAKLHMPKDMQDEMVSQKSIATPAMSGQKSLAMTSQKSLAGKRAKMLDTAREMWPITTNLCREEVAGPGLLLQFNFQALVIGWSVVMLVCFVILAFYVDLEILRLGTRQADTSWENCILLAFGRMKYGTFNLPLAGFVIFVYVVSFTASIAYGIRSQTIFQDMDEKYITHKDFCAKVKGIPCDLDGSMNVEEELKEALEEFTGLPVVGVSVCWSYSHHDEEFVRVVENDLCQLEAREVEEREEYLRETGEMIHEASVGDAAEGQARKPSWFQKLETTIFDDSTHKFLEHSGSKGSKELPGSGHEISSTPSRTPSGVPQSRTSSYGVGHREALKEALRDLKTAGEAFAVFDTEKDRDEAVEAANDGIPWKDSKLHLVKARCEPQSVNWSNYACSRTRLMLVKRLVKGLLVIACALMIWVLCFYLPYVVFIGSINYEYEEPGILLSAVFSMLVVLGNALMYVVCGEVSDRIRFLRMDDREVCYMILYTFACLFNVVLDLVVTYWLAYTMMSAQHMSTFDGTPLSKVKAFPDAMLETYVLPREVGSQYLFYALGTFPIPAIVEPWVTIYLPYQLMTLIVRSHRITGERAESYLGAFRMDLSRYADLLLNLILMSVAFFLPSGYIFQLFLLLVVSHIGIYCFDHWRVLRSVPSCIFTSLKVDKCAQVLLSIPCAVLLTNAVWRLRCEVFKGKYCDDSAKLVRVCVLTFFGHIIIHVVIVLCVIPLFKKKVEPGTQNYKDHCARRLPASWFSCNPIHCLRSKYHYKHNPPCDYWVPGKEHLLRVNEDLGLYFHDVAMEGETFEATPMDPVVRALKHLQRNPSSPTPSTERSASFGLGQIWRGESSPAVMATRGDSGKS